MNFPEIHLQIKVVFKSRSASLLRCPPNLFREVLVLGRQVKRVKRDASRPRLSTINSKSSIDLMPKSAISVDGMTGTHNGLQV